MKTLNRRYRGKNKTTDVLAFAIMEGDNIPTVETTLLGDIVISIPQLKRQAATKNAAAYTHKKKNSPYPTPQSVLSEGFPVEYELKLLLAHGLLHLLGFDHMEVHEERRMKSRTDFLISVGRSLHLPQKSA